MKLEIALVSLVAVGACGGGTSSTPGGGGTDTTPGAASLEGTWDITSYGSDAIGPSSVTVAGGKLTGTLAFAAGSSNCARTLDFAIQGNALTGSSSPAAGCAGGRAATVTGTRTTPQPDSDTPWNGTWTIQEGGSSKTGELTISGLSAVSGDFRMTVAGGSASASGPTKYTFAARRR